MVQVVFGYFVVGWAYGCVLRAPMRILQRCLSFTCKGTQQHALWLEHSNIRAGVFHL